MKTGDSSVGLVVHREPRPHAPQRPPPGRVPAGQALYLNPVGAELAGEIIRLTSLGTREEAEGWKGPWAARVDLEGRPFTTPDPLSSPRVHGVGLTLERIGPGGTFPGG